MTRGLENLVSNRLINMVLAGCWTVAAGNAVAVPEHDLAKMQAEITQFNRSRLITGEFVGAGGKKIAWAKIDGDKNLPPIVVSVGLSESYLHYEEFIYDLKAVGKNQQGFFVFDLRSQGYSERLAADGSLLHVESFDDYVSDLETFIDTKVRPEYPKPARVMAHSTGGLIAFRLFSRRPELAEKIVFVAPLFGINYGSAPQWLMRWVAEVFNVFGFHEKTVPFRVNSGLPPFDKNKLTYSEARYHRLTQVQDILPPPVSIGPSVGFVVATQRALAELDNAAEKFAVPSLVLTADEDLYTSTEASKKICSMMKSCEYLPFTQARHVLTQETDVNRSKVFAAIISYLSVASVEVK